MIQRLVKFTIKNGRQADFLQLCDDSKEDFAPFLQNGCIDFKFWQDTRVPTIFFSLTVWESQNAVDHYHYSNHSTLFWKNAVEFSALSPEVFVLKNV